MLYELSYKVALAVTCVLPACVEAGVCEWDSGPGQTSPYTRTFFHESQCVDEALSLNLNLR